MPLKKLRELAERKKNPLPIEFNESDLILNDDGSVYHLSLLPQNISDTIITVGDPGRVYKVSEHFDNIEFEMNKREFITHTGTYKGKRLTVISTGMGTDNVEIFMNELDALVNIDLKTRRRKEKPKSLKIIRIGTSGALQPDIRLGSHLVSANAVGLDTLMLFYKLKQSDEELTNARNIQELLNLPFTPYCVSGSKKLIKKLGEGMVMGNTVTCPGFYAPQGRVLRCELAIPNFINDLMYFNDEDFWLTNFEMETAGYYALGRLLGHEVISLNAIVANRANGKFSKSPNKVVDSLIKKTLDRIVAP